MNFINERLRPIYDATPEQLARLTPNGQAVARLVLDQKIETIKALTRVNGKNDKTNREALARIERALALPPDLADRYVAGGAADPADVHSAWLKNKDGDSIYVYHGKAEAENGMHAFLDRVIEAVRAITPIDPIPAPAYTDADLLTVYPIADAHIGMLAWGKETGADYDTEIATTRLKNWIARAVAAAPSSRTAMILDVGDLTHADDQTNQTRQSKHILDVDTRHYRTVDETIEALGAAIELALAKHEEVIVQVLPGNHNPTAYIPIVFALAERYRLNPRVTVIKRPGEHFVHVFGNVMIAAHHGDKAKPERLVMALADAHAKEWGTTLHRYLFTGHLHHLKMADIGGVQWEQLRAMTELDAYAVSHAYRGRAQLQAITYHREAGEIERAKIGAISR